MGTHENAIIIADILVSPRRASVEHAQSFKVQALLLGQAIRVFIDVQVEAAASNDMT